MATRQIIQFNGADGKRKTLSLSGYTRRQRDSMNRHVRALNASRMANLPLDEETGRWLADIDDTLRTKLSAVGLLEIQERQSATLGTFIAEYAPKREALVACGKLVADTLRNERVTWDSLLDCFGADKRLRDFTEGDAEQFRHYLLTMGGLSVKRCGPATVIRKRIPLAEATTRKRCCIASKVFRAAVRLRLIVANPFDTDAVPKSNIATERKAYIDWWDAHKVMEELPTTEWKLLFALSRWGGLRVGSEVRLLTWNDFYWDEQKFVVHSPKTKRYAGHDTREVPIFPELAPLLDKRYAEAAVGDMFVLPMMQGRSDAAFRKTLERAIKRAGLEVWARLWHNMRVTRQTELTNEHPPHVVNKWMGNSKPIAEKHYLQVTAANFAKAAEGKPVYELLRRPEKALHERCGSSRRSGIITSNKKRKTVANNK